MAFVELFLLSVTHALSFTTFASQSLKCIGVSLLVVYRSEPPTNGLPTIPSLRAADASPAAPAGSRLTAQPAPGFYGRQS